MDLRRPTRRATLAAFAAGGSVLAGTGRAAPVRDPCSGEALYDWVRSYDALGEHRTASRGDNATSLWLARELKRAGLKPSLQPFRFPLYEPSVCTIGLPGKPVAAFPAWPVTPTPESGLRAPLQHGDSVSLAGAIALLRLPFKPGGSWALPGYGEAVMDCTRRGACGVIVVTEGPTGLPIALNAAPDRFHWQVPVVIAGGADGDRLAAATGQQVTLHSRGKLEAKATASNVIGVRRGTGKAIVVSTPKSGWFHCAGERGSGIAIFLGLAHWLVRETSSNLLFVATSGHEIDQMGSALFLNDRAPSPQDTRLWFHIGANAAVQHVEMREGEPVSGGIPEAQRQLIVSEQLYAIAREAFADCPGYRNPVLLDLANAVGELRVFQKGGYRPLAGLVGASPLFHTSLDRTRAATTPAVLAAIAHAACEFMRTLS